MCDTGCIAIGDRTTFVQPFVAHRFGDIKLNWQFFLYFILMGTIWMGRDLLTIQRITAVAPFQYTVSTSVRINPLAVAKY